MSEAYKSAGVDITAGYRAVELMKGYIADTMTKHVISDIGGFGGMFELPTGYKKPVLVSGTDGVGTKLKLSFILEKYDTVGIDCVAMCVNDIICCGAKPLFFLDYIACGKNYPEKIADIVKGISIGCKQSEVALIGGETAEMDKDNVIDNKTMNEGDVIIALESSGVHSNGFSLVRKVFDLDNKTKKELSVPIKELKDKSLGETLIEPTKIYVKQVLKVLENIKVKGISHITGGGFYENIPRSIPNGLGAKIDIKDVKILPIFDYIKELGNISTQDMFNTFNMGVGMTLVVERKDVDKTLEILNSENAYVLGSIVKSDEKLILG